MDFESLMSEFRERAQNKAEQGRLFEKFVRKYLEKSKLYSFETVWLWSEFPYSDHPDNGIDLVAKHKGVESYTAVQCKFFDENDRVDKKDIDSFMSESGKSFFVDGKRMYFSGRMIVSTCRWSGNAETAVENQWIPVCKLDLSEFLKDGSVDWASFSLDNIDGMRRSGREKTLRQYQKEAIERVMDGFKTADRGRLIMACGTGKTFTSLKLAEKMGGGIYCSWPLQYLCCPRPSENG